MVLPPPSAEALTLAGTRRLGREICAAIADEVDGRMI
jgi:hypothetical protein